jgi:hypothetical protein
MIFFLFIEKNINRLIILFIKFLKGKKKNKNFYNRVYQKKKKNFFNLESLKIGEFI